MARLPISSALPAIVIALLVLAAPASLGHADPEPPVVTDVRMGEPGDRWLDLMQYRRIERATIDGVFGYAITYHGADGEDLVFYYPRGAIDLAGERPLTTRLVMKVRGGRVWYPDRLTATSLPRVYKGRPSGAAVHHIVARTAKKAKPARDVLQKYGIDMDDAVNGVFLPATRKSPNPAGASVHATLHTKKYYKAVNDLLKQANTRSRS